MILIMEFLEIQNKKHREWLEKVCSVQLKLIYTLFKIIRFDFKAMVIFVKDDVVAKAY